MVAIALGSASKPFNRGPSGSGVGEADVQADSAVIESNRNMCFRDLNMPEIVSRPEQHKRLEPMSHFHRLYKADPVRVLENVKRKQLS